MAEKKENATVYDLEKLSPEEMLLKLREMEILLTQKDDALNELKQKKEKGNNRVKPNSQAGNICPDNIKDVIKYSGLPEEIMHHISWKVSHEVGERFVPLNTTK